MAAHSTIATTKKVEVTISLPSLNFDEAFKRFKSMASTLFSNIYTPINNSVSNAAEAATSRSRRIGFQKMGKMKFQKKYFKFIFPVVIGIVVLGVLVSLIRSLPDAKSQPANTTEVAVPDALSTVNLNKKFSFPLKDDKGAVVGNFDYVVQSAAIQKQIIVQGQRATAVDGRDFLILNLKITNNLKKTIQLNTRDYIRFITVGHANEQLAPDIHNDPVEVQAISTKYTRVGIALDETDTKKTIQLKVGEIDGTKQDIDLNFKY